MIEPLAWFVGWQVFTVVLSLLIDWATWRWMAWGDRIWQRVINTPLATEEMRW